MVLYINMTLRERHVISNYRSFDCLFHSVCGPTSKKHPSQALLAFLRGVHRWPVTSPHKGPVRRKKLPFADAIMKWCLTSWCSCAVTVMLIPWFQCHLRNVEYFSITGNNSHGVLLLNKRCFGIDPAIENRIKERLSSIYLIKNTMLHVNSHEYEGIHLVVCHLG